jgi:hypothetical protein
MSLKATTCYQCVNHTSSAVLMSTSKSIYPTNGDMAITYFHLCTLMLKGYMRVISEEPSHTSAHNITHSNKTLFQWLEIIIICYNISGVGYGPVTVTFIFIPAYKTVLHYEP